MPKKTLSFCLAIFLSATQFLLAQNQPPTVTGVAAAVDSLESTVSFSFDLLDAESDSLEISLRLSNDNGDTYLLKPDSLSGDIGFPVFPG